MTSQILYMMYGCVCVDILRFVSVLVCILVCDVCACVAHDWSLNNNVLCARVACLHACLFQVDDKRQHVSVRELGDSSLEAQLQTEREALDRKEKEVMYWSYGGFFLSHVWKGISK